MIIFYNKHTGKVTGIIHGKKHPREEFNMWIGDPKSTKRLIFGVNNGMVSKLGYEKLEPGEKEAVLKVIKNRDLYKNLKVDTQKKTLLYK